MAQFEDLEGEVFTKVENNGDEIIFYTETYTYHLGHVQELYECVFLESIEGDLNDLVDTPILMASEETECGEHGEWTFYKLATIKGYVDIRWYGHYSFYGCSVDFIKRGIK